MGARVSNYRLYITNKSRPNSEEFLENSKRAGLKNRDLKECPECGTCGGFHDEGCKLEKKP